MIEVKSRVTNGSTRTDDEVWSWISTRIEICEECCLIESTRIDSLSYRSFDSSDDLILSTIGDRKYSGHLFSSFGFFYGIEEEAADIRGHEPEITNYIKANRIFYEFFYEFWDFITEELEYSRNLEL